VRRPQLLVDGPQPLQLRLHDNRHDSRHDGDDTTAGMTA
jgi:hypothetical protein